MTQSRPVPSGDPETSGSGRRLPAHHSAMCRRFGMLPTWFARTAFRHARVDPADIERLHRLANEGTVVYVMRYTSLVDYFLINYVLLRERLPLARFANGISSLWLRPLGDVIAILWSGLRSAHLFGKEVRRFRERDLVAQLTLHGRSVLLFIRSRRTGFARQRGGRPGRDGARGTDFLREIVHGLWGNEQPIYLVPLAIFRGSGLRRKGSRLASFVYSVHEAPSDVKRMVTYLWNARELTVSVGAEIPLNAFLKQYQRDGEDRVVRRLTRALQIFLYREERVVWGPTLRSKRQVRDLVLGSDDLRESIRRTAAERRVPEEKVAREARGYFDEMAADFRGYYFAVIAYAFKRIWYRMFSGLEIRGLERVVERLKQHPIVLVPCHRSHFDYLILSYIFHDNFLSPPHIAAGINMAFWPMGPFFRGAGAYFIRRSFEGNPLYKMVFRKYLEYLIREGYTQEFFIEGGRSRTGKILTPKLGMLSAIIDAFVDGVRRDLFLVPVSIHYGRIVEEEAYKSELLGGEKERESFAALIKARRVLRQKYGTVYVTFAEPISLGEALGDRKERFRDETDPTIENERRYFTQKLGFRLLREVNEVAVAGATSVSSTVLLAAPHQAIRYAEFVRAARALADLLVAKGVTPTSSLLRNLETFRESLSFLQTGKLIDWMKDRDGDIIYVSPEKRLILDFYKNNIIHFFLIPSLVAHAVRRGVASDGLRDEVWWWLDLFRWEFALPERDAVAAEIDGTMRHFGDSGAFRVVPGIDEHPLLSFGDGILENFREAYWIAAKTLLDVQKEGLPRKSVMARMQKSFALHQLLGQTEKPEGNSAMIFQNAVNRFAELGYVVVDRGRGKDPTIAPGPAVTGLAALERRLADSLATTLARRIASGTLPGDASPPSTTPRQATAGA